MSQERIAALTYATVVEAGAAFSTTLLRTGAPPSAQAIQAHALKATVELLDALVKEPLEVGDLQLAIRTLIAGFMGFFSDTVLKHMELVAAAAAAAAEQQARIRAQQTEAEKN